MSNFDEKYISYKIKKRKHYDFLFCIFENFTEIKSDLTR